MPKDKTSATAEGEPKATRKGSVVSAHEDLAEKLERDIKYQLEEEQKYMTLATEARNKAEADQATLDFYRGQLQKAEKKNR